MIVAFDLEIATPIVGKDWEEQRPLGISCAAAVADNGKKFVWNGSRKKDGILANRMSPAQVRAMVLSLENLAREGYKIVTWNGLGFDFDVVAEECRSRAWARRVAKLALDHIDPGFEMVCQRGFMIGLQKAADALRVQGKTKGMHGDLAPLLWSGDLSTASDEQKASIIDLLADAPAGSKWAQELCLEYVIQDAQATLNVYLELVNQKEVWWITAKGTICRYPWRPKMNGDHHLLTVQESMQIDIPDTSWMSDPRPRSEYFGWAKDVLSKRQVSL